MTQAQEKDKLQSPGKNFEGFALQAAVGFQPYLINSNNISVNNSQFNLPNQNYSGSSIPYFVGLSYTAAVSNQVTIGAQIEINPVNQQYVLSVLPGYAFTPDLNGYLKIAWVNALVTIDPGASQNKFSLTANGATAGIGIRQLWTPAWYGFAEVNYVRMNTFKFNSTINNVSVTGNADYSGYNVMLGIGYKF